MTQCAFDKDRDCDVDCCAFYQESYSVDDRANTFQVKSVIKITCKRGNFVIYDGGDE